MRAFIICAIFAGLLPAAAFTADAGRYRSRDADRREVQVRERGSDHGARGDHEKGYRPRHDSRAGEVDSHHRERYHHVHHRDHHHYVDHGDHLHVRHHTHHRVHHSGH